MTRSPSPAVPIAPLRRVGGAPRAGDAYAEFARVLLYLALFLIAAVAISPSSLGRAADGLAVAAVIVVTASVASRLFPGLVDTATAFRFLPFGLTRLNYPIG